MGNLPFQQILLTVSSKSYSINYSVAFCAVKFSKSFPFAEADWYEVQVKALSANGDGEPTVNVIHTRLPNQSTQFANTTSSIDRVSIFHM